MSRAICVQIGFCVVGIFREKGQAASGIGELGQGGAGLLHSAPVVLEVVIAEYAHGVNHSVIALGLFDGVLEAMTAGIILAVGYHKNYLLIARAFLQVIERTDHSIVERCAARASMRSSAVFNSVRSLVKSCSLSR